MIEGPARVQSRQISSGLNRFKLGAMAFDKTDVLAQCVGNDENIGEQNRSIRSKPFNRLQGHSGSPLRGVAKIEKPVGLGAKFPVFWEKTSCLAHKPERGPRSGLAGEGVEKKIGHSGYRGLGREM